METTRRGSMALCSQLTQLSSKVAKSYSIWVTVTTACFIQGESIDKHYHLMCELSASKKQRERLETKLKRIKKLMQDAKKDGKDTIKVRGERRGGRGGRRREGGEGKRGEGGEGGGLESKRLPLLSEEGSDSPSAFPG